MRTRTPPALLRMVADGLDTGRIPRRSASAVRIPDTRAPGAARNAGTLNTGAAGRRAQRRAHSAAATHAVRRQARRGACCQVHCPQAARYHTGVANEAMLPLGEVAAAAAAAQAAGATRFCMGAAWRGPRDRDLEPVLAMVREVKALGLETCATLGMLKDGQAEALKRAGLDYYNHNLDTAPEFYGEIITTREYRDRLETLDRVRRAGIKVCCGGIVGMGESRAARAGLIVQLANLDPYPESVPINNLVQVEGTPLYGTEPIDPLEFVRTVAVARITMPRAMVRLSAGRRELGDGIQALCFFAGANSIFYGDKLLTTGHPDVEADQAMLRRLGLTALQPAADEPDA